MDDQTTPYQSASAPRRGTRKPGGAGQAQPGQPVPANGSTQPVPPIQPYPGAMGNGPQQPVYPTRQFPPVSPPNASRPQPGPQPGPQPILFSEIEIEVLDDTTRTPTRGNQRFKRTRSWLRSRTGRIIIPAVALLVGLSIGLSSLLWYGLSGAGSLVIIPNAAQGNLIVEVDKSFLTQLVSQDISSAGLPGQVRNVSIALARGDALTVQGDDAYTVLGLSLSRHFVVGIQPYVKSCVLQVRVTSANLGGIPVTGFVQLFQNKINQQLSKKPAGLPDGFTYCTASVRTETGGMFVTYKATAVTKK